MDTRIPFDPFQPDGTFFVPPGSPDTDNDSLADGWEDYWFEGNLAALSGAGDYDSDGSNDLAEFNNGTFPNDSDTDNDGLNDGGETTAGSNPRLADTDGDGRTDGEEVNGAVTSNPTDADTDDDGFNDGAEVLVSSSPTNAADTPLTYAIADSQTEFSGVQGAGNWSYGYRNFTADGGAAAYDPAAHFIPFVGGSGDPSAWNGTTQQWNAATGWDLNTAGAAPWTIIGVGGGNQDTHPNSASQVAPNNVPVTPRPFVAQFVTVTSSAVTLRWPSHSAYLYDLEVSTDLDADPANWIQIIDSLPPEPPPAEWTSYTHNLTGPFAHIDRLFYRVNRRRP